MKDHIWLGSVKNRMIWAENVVGNDKTLNQFDMLY